MQFVGKKVEWDPKKNASNLKKHGISFEEAYTTFFDSNAVEFYDDDNPDEESLFFFQELALDLGYYLVSAEKVQNFLKYTEWQQ